MTQLIVWKNAQANGKTFTVTAITSNINEARRLSIRAIAGLVPQTLSEAEAEALLNWIYEKAPVVGPHPVRAGPARSIHCRGERAVRQQRYAR
jgi:hypothetical protein